MENKEFYLDLNKVAKLYTNEERQIIHGYYTDMLNAFSDERMVYARSIMNTLINGGYLLENEKEGKILS
jgi:hypothetical protein